MLEIKYNQHCCKTPIRSETYPCCCLHRRKLTDPIKRVGPAERFYIAVGLTLSVVTPLELWDNTEKPHPGIKLKNKKIKCRFATSVPGNQPTNRKHKLFLWYLPYWTNLHTVKVHWQEKICSCYTIFARAENKCV